MEPEASLPWLALTMTPDIAARLPARLLREYGTPEGVFHASFIGHESSNLTARIIAGMPLGVVIVEGKQYGGSLITGAVGFWSARECDRGTELCAKPVEPAGSGARDKRLRCDRRAANPGKSGFGACSGGGGGAAKFAGKVWVNSNRGKGLRDF